MRPSLFGLSFLFFATRPRLVVVVNASPSSVGDDDGGGRGGPSAGVDAPRAAARSLRLVGGPDWVVCGGVRRHRGDRFWGCGGRGKCANAAQKAREQSHSGAKIKGCARA